ncbi:hypothetical protein TNIN_106531, partial [Trichonephila inaurata madagascariensis]
MILSEDFYRSPYDLDPEIFVTESPYYARRCKSFIKKIRNSKSLRRAAQTHSAEGGTKARHCRDER